MSTPAKPSAPKLPGDDRNLVQVDESYAAPSLEDRLRLLWEQNRQLIVFAVVVVVLALVGREVIGWYAAKRDRAISAAYAEADGAEAKRAFASAHPKHPLAGIAWLEAADLAYTAGRFAEAVADYAQAAPALAGNPLQSRARLGLALATIQNGDTTAGAEQLRRLAADIEALRGVRTEARYHLAVLAYADGRVEEARTLIDEILQTDLSGAWAQRALALRSSLPVAPPPVGSAPAEGEASEGLPAIRVNLPGSTEP
jgi:tetratricopeptide (TPR) repeat protein